ncbi:hypothetical protein [Paraburkholderia azotifigens]|uniref:hypothetical protein n=1 Tax=Paraburkholderia azotifigens TaxID=2057004 RepID=UPI0038B6D9F1
MSASVVDELNVWKRNSDTAEVAQIFVVGCQGRGRPGSSMVAFETRATQCLNSEFVTSFRTKAMQTQETPHKATAPVKDRVVEQYRGPTDIRDLPHGLIVSCATFRDAVQLSWKHRTDRGMKKNELASALGEKNPAFATNILHPDAFDRKGGRRQTLPDWHWDKFVLVVGNRGIYQWFEHKGMLLLLEELLKKEGIP